MQGVLWCYWADLCKGKFSLDQFWTSDDGSDLDNISTSRGRWQQKKKRKEVAHRHQIPVPHLLPLHPHHPLKPGPLKGQKFMLSSSVRVLRSIWTRSLEGWKQMYNVMYRLLGNFFVWILQRNNLSKRKWQIWKFPQATNTFWSCCVKKQDTSKQDELPSSLLEISSEGSWRKTDIVQTHSQNLVTLLAEIPSWIKIFWEKVLRKPEHLKGNSSQNYWH